MKARGNRGSALPLILLIVVALALAGGIFYLYQQERAKNLSLNEQLQEVNNKYKITDEELRKTKQYSSDLEFKLRASETKITNITDELQKEKAAREDALMKLEEISSALEQQKTLRTDLENKLTQAHNDLKKLQEQLKTLENKKVELENKLKEMSAVPSGGAAQNNVELGTIVVTPESAKAVPAASKTPAKANKPKAALEGKVLVINKEYNFAIINLGNKDGVGVGDIFVVYHANKHIGDISVEKVHDSMSAAGFLSADLKNKVSEGDKVVAKTK